MESKLRTRTGGRRRATGERIAQSLAIASQMSLLCPPGLDEWMQRELSGNVVSAPGTNDPRHRTTRER